MEYKFKDLLEGSIHTHLYDITIRFNYLKEKMLNTEDFYVIDSHRYTVLDKIREGK